MRDLGPYAVEAELGEGGMGRVVRARHVATGRPVALKVVRAAEPALRDALRREIRALAALDHPGVVRVLDDGVTDEGPWYAMEVVDGASLKDAWRAGPVTWDGATLTLAEAPVVAEGGGGVDPAQWPRWSRVLGRLCHALAHLHAEGLVHGDLKPSNVLLRDDDEPVLVDFGLTTRIGWRDDAGVLSLTASPAGTAAYIAPERVLGRPADGRSDLYALGCMIYEALTGRPPFEGEPEAVFAAHAATAAVPVAARAPWAPPDLAALVDALLDKDPRRRPGRAQEVAARLGVPDPAPPLPVLFRPALAGRRDALDALRARLDALDAGRGGAVVLEGASGAGKTRLALEVLAEARARRVTVVAGACVAASDPQHSALSPFAGWFALAARAGTDAARLLGPRGAVLARHAPSLARLPGFDALPDPGDLPADLGRAAVAESLVHLVRSLATGPAAWLVDDVQWADPLAARALDAVAEAGLPVLLVATRRSGEGAGALPAAPTLPVGPLDADAVVDMLADRLGAPPPEPLRRACAVAGGNALLVGEVVRVAAARGALVPVPGGWSCADDLPARIPTDPEALLAERFDPLSEPAAALLDAAAVAGPAAPGDVLARVSGLGVDAALSVAHELDRADLVVTRPDGRLAFAHDALRRAAYGRMPPERLRAAHARAAAALAERADAAPFEVATHLDRAGDAPAARRAYAEAGDLAVARYALEEAEVAWRRAAELGAPGEPARLEVLADLGRRALLRGGRIADAAEVADAVLAEIDADALPDLAATVSALRSEARQLQGRYDEARDDAERAERLARTAAARADVARVRANLATRTGRPAEALGHARAGLDHARASGTQHVEPDLARAGAVAAWLAGDLDTARALALEGRASAVAAGRHHVAAALDNLLGNLALDRDDMEAAQAHHAAARDAFERCGDRRQVAIARSNLAIHRERAGDADGAAAELRVAVDTLRRLGDERAAAAIELNLAETLERAHRHESAHAAFSQAAAFLEPRADLEAPRALVGLARAGRVLGVAIQERAALLDRAAAVAATADTPAAWVPVHCARVHLAVEAGADPGPHLAAAREAVAGLDPVPEWLSEPLRAAEDAAAGQR